MLWKKTWGGGTVTAGGRPGPIIPYESSFQGMEVAQRGEATCLRSHSSFRQQLDCHLPALPPASSPIASLLPTVTLGEPGWRAQGLLNGGLAPAPLGLTPS